MKYLHLFRFFNARFALLNIVIVFLLFGASSVEAQKRRSKSGKPVAKKTVKRQATTSDLLAFIHQVAENYGIPGRLYESLLRVEGGGICNQSPKGARGISQLMPATARRFGLRVDSQVDERCDVVKAANVGAMYLRWLLNNFQGDVALALAGYNAGEGAVMKYGYRIPPYKETTQYVEKIGLLYTGRSGLALTRAYDTQKAARLIAPLYAGRRSVPALPQYIPPAGNVNYSSELVADGGNNALSEIGDETASADRADDSSEKAEQPPKTVRRAAVEVQPRIKTSSIFYWSKNK